MTGCMIKSVHFTRRAGRAAGNVNLRLRSGALISNFTIRVGISRAYRIIRYRRRRGEARRRYRLGALMPD